MFLQKVYIKLIHYRLMMSMSKSEIIIKFVDEYNSKNTRNAYTSTLGKFFKEIRQDPETYFHNGRDYGKDIKTFMKYLNNSKKAKTTKVNSINAVKQFFIFNDVELPQKFWRVFRKKEKHNLRNKPVTLDDAPSHEKLQKILRYSDVRTRAVILTALSSGMRIGELAKINISDIDLKHNPAIITVRGEITKTGDSRIAFISNEAKKAIKAWLDVRDTFLIKINNRLKNIKSRNKDYIDNRLFGISDQCIRRFWNIYLEQASLNERDKNTQKEFRKYHFHTLRKFFQTYMSMEMEDKFVKILMGHIGYLGESYDRIPIDILGKKYLDAMHQVSITEVSPTVKEMGGQLSQLQQENAELRRKMDDMNQTMLILLAKKEAEK